MLPPILTWLALPHLPKVPERFVQRVRELGQPNPDLNDEELLKGGHITKEYKYRTVRYRGVESVTRCQESFLLGEDWEQWVRENIVADFIGTSGRVNVGPTGSTTHGAHIDQQHQMRLYYLIDRGGDDAETIWFYEPGKPLVYDLDRPSTSTPVSANDMDALLEIDRVKFPLCTWVLTNGYILHGVEKVTGRRLNITVDIRPECFDFHIIPKKWSKH